MGAVEVVLVMMVLLEETVSVWYVSRWRCVTR